MVMNSSSARRRQLLTLTICSLALLVLGLVWMKNSKTQTTLRELRQDLAEFHAKAEVAEVTMSSLRSELQERRSSARPAEVPASASFPDQELNTRLGNLTRRLSNTTARLEQLLTRTSDGIARSRETTIAVLESSAQEQQQKYEAARQKAVDLLVSLNVPPEVSNLEAAKALDTANFQAYWPYFEAKRDRDSLRFLAEASDAINSRASRCAA